MALLPNWFSASTKAIAEKALDRGILKYPGMCYIEDTQSLAWVTQDNQIKYMNNFFHIICPVRSIPMLQHHKWQHFQ